MQKTWWKESIIYQIYPRSFNDSNGDGIGDIKGIIDKLDYIKSLGVDVIWVCPVYKSPNDDNGYDISDYYQIMDDFGTMDDFDELLRQTHDRGMKLIMDLVANHTSDEHPWFLESRKSRDNPYRDYYIWKDPNEGGAPNNWQSFFGGDAWEFDENTGQYYLHLFTRKQPDLNWENKKVRQEIYEMMRYWLDKGIDGYRMDVISLISKRGYDDAPVQGFNETIENIYANGPMVHEYLQEMNREVLSKYDVFSVGEGPGISLREGLNYVKEDRHELSMIFHFDHMFIDHGPEGKFDPVPYDLVHFKEVFTQWDKTLSDGGWSSIFLGNHDFPRIVSRFGNDEDYHDLSAKALALMLLSLRGTTYIYQGEEIGMTNVAFESIDQYRDIETLNAYRQAVQEGRNLDDFLKAVHWQGRDNARTPMQWNQSVNAGFTSGNPWLDINPNYKKINVATQQTDPDSILNFYRQMIKVRKNNLTLVYGEYEVIDVLNSKNFIYRRSDDENEYYVFINFSEEMIPFNLQSIGSIKQSHVLVSNYKEEVDIAQNLYNLKPWEATIFKTK